MNTYEMNLKVLEERYPDYAKLVESTTIDEGKIRFIYTERGEPAIEYKGDVHQVIHSYANPDQWDGEVSRLLTEIGDSGVLLILGFGFGSVAREFLQKLGEGHLLVIYEATPDLFKMVCRAVDLRELLVSERVQLILGDYSDKLGFIGRYHRDVAQGRLWTIKQDASIRVNRKAYEKFLQTLKSEKIRLDTNIVTLFTIGKEFSDKCMENVTNLLGMPGVVSLAGCLKDRPAIIVSAGPSLEKNLHLLKSAKGRATIIAVDAALQTLVPAGIMPDVAVGLDAFSDNVGMFKDNPLLRNTPFICIPQYTPKIMSMYPGPLFLSGALHNSIYEWLKTLWEEKGTIMFFGGSVSHLAFATAEYFGAKHIALVGQDFCYKDKFHAGEVSRLLEEAYGAETYTEIKKISFPVRDIFGEERSTIKSFLSYRKSFEDKIGAFDGVVVNATEGGLAIEGAKTMRLADFIDRYCDVPEVDVFPIFAELAGKGSHHDLPAILARVKDVRKKLSQIRESASEMVTCLNRIKKLKAKNRLQTPEAGHIVAKMEVLEKKTEDPVLDIIAIYRYRMDNYLKKELAMEEVDVIEEPLEYYGELVRIIAGFNEKLNYLVDTLEREHEIGLMVHDASLPAFERFCAAAFAYRDMGLVRKAVTYLEGAAGIVSGLITEDTLRDHWESLEKVYITLIELYLQQYRCYEARELINTIGGLQDGLISTGMLLGENERLKEVSETCREMIKTWESRQDRMEGILRNAERNYGSTLDSGHFYFRVRDYEMARDCYRRATEDIERFMKGAGHRDEASQNALALLFISACYSLAHTFSVLNRKEEATTALDRAALSLEKITDAGLFPQLGEMRRLITALYRKLGEKGKALSVLKEVQERP